MSGSDAATIKAAIQTCEFGLPAERPRLLFGPEHVEEIRLRAAKRDGMLERIEQRCRAWLAGDATRKVHLRSNFTRSSNDAIAGKARRQRSVDHLAERSFRAVPARLRCVAPADSRDDKCTQAPQPRDPCKGGESFEVDGPNGTNGIVG